MQPEPLKLSVVLPVYNERETIGKLLETLHQTLTDLGLSFEIIAVEDGSGDGTAAVLQDLVPRYEGRLRVITHPYNKGNGAAVKEGIWAARGEVIACMDADGQHDPQDLASLLPYMDEYDLVVGARAENKTASWHRSLANRFYNALASWLTDFKVQDLTSGFRLFRASIVKKYAHIFPARFSYPTTSTLIFLKNSYNVKYVPISIRARQGGASKIKTIADGWKFIIIIFKIVTLYEPMRIFLPFSLVSFVLGLISAVYGTYVMKELFIPNSSVTLFILGVLVFLLGLVSEQITMIQISQRDGR